MADETKSTRRDRIQIDRSNPKRPEALVPLTLGQLADLEELCKKEALEYETGTRSEAQFRALAELMRIAQVKFHAAKAIEQNDEQAQPDSAVTLANQVIRKAVGQLQPDQIARYLETDLAKAKKVHSLLRQAKVAP